MFQFYMWLKYFRSGFEKIAGAGFFLPVLFFIRKWYFFMLIPAIYVVYKLFYHLQLLGVITKFASIVAGAMHGVVFIADECFPKLLDMGNFTACVASANFEPSADHPNLDFEPSVNEDQNQKQIQPY
jgi:hypothetical protein